MRINRVIDSLSKIDDLIIHEVACLRSKRTELIRKRMGLLVASICLTIVGASVLGIIRTGNKNIQEQLLDDISNTVESSASSLISRFLPVGDRIACYNNICLNSQKLASHVGEEYIKYKGEQWYRVKKMDEIKYLICLEENQTYSLWEYEFFYVIDSEVDILKRDGASEIQIEQFESEVRAKYPGANLSTYTYGDVYRMIYNVESADKIASIIATAPNSNNTDKGIASQKEVGINVYENRNDVEFFYECMKKLVCKGFTGGHDYEDKYTYSFGKDSTKAGRYLTITLQSGTTIDNWKYDALAGMFYQYGGIFSVQMQEEDVYAINKIFGIE